VRPRGCRTVAATGILVVLSLAGCAPQTGNLRGPAPSTAGGGGGGAPGAQPERSARGNPPFYDVLGKRYHVLDSSEGYRARGVASWYGRDFHGLATSSGEIYDMHAMTAAHTTLPLPSWVEVTNLENGKRIVVKVNDRGPFVANRIIDLSYAAAQELDMVRDGTVRVEVRALAVGPRAVVAASAPPAAAAPPSAPAPASAGGVSLVSAGALIGASTSAAALSSPGRAATQTSMYVQVGAFGVLANAEGLAARLRAAGFGNARVATSEETGRTLHRVRVGPVASSSEFDAVRAQLARAGFGETRLLVDR
jgi:rare lipoprotein A